MELDLSSLYRTLARRFRKVERCDLVDAVASSQVVIWEARDNGTVVHNAEAYCTTVAHRYISRELRRRKRHLHLEQVDPMQWEAMVVEEPDVLVDAHEVLEQAPKLFSEIMRLHYLEGRSLEDIAKHLGITSMAARKRHERALKWARKAFAEPLGND